MKICNSTIHFCTKQPIDTIPYWHVYSTKHDHLAKQLGHPWNSTRNLTYDEIVSWLLKSGHKRSLVAYPRKNRSQNRLAISCNNYQNTYCVYDEGTLRVLIEVCGYNIHDIRYIDPSIKQKRKYKLIKFIEQYIKEAHKRGTMMNELSNINKLYASNNKNHRLFAALVTDMRHSNGYYGRLYNDVNDMSPDTFRLLQDAIAEQQFNDTLDVVLWLES